jgi:hypothetical protein
MKTLCIAIFGFIPSLLFAQSSHYTPFVTARSNGVTLVEYIDSTTIRRIKGKVIALYRRMWINEETKLVIQAQSTAMVLDCSDNSYAVLMGRNYNDRGQLTDSMEVSDFSKVVWNRIEPNTLMDQRRSLLCGRAS